jgi:hypothetical protein
MLWSGVVTFVILLVMELVIQGYRHLRGIPEPTFQLVLERDSLLDHEIGEEVLAKEGGGVEQAVLRVVEGDRELRLMMDWSWLK